jgi:hypothetical protein
MRSLDRVDRIAAAARWLFTYTQEAKKDSMV